VSIVAIYFVLVAIALAAAIGSVVLGRRRRAARWPVAVLACFALGAIWQEIALATFAAREPQGLRGLILRPVPLGGGDHAFEPRGAHYAKFSFLVPGATALAASLLVCLLAVALKRDGVTGPVALAAVGGALAYALLAVARLLAASDIFI
jgi:hypothetical protein